MNSTQQLAASNSQVFKLPHKELQTDIEIGLSAKHAKALCNHPITNMVLTLPKGVFCLADGQGFSGSLDQAYRNLLTDSSEGYRKPVNPSKFKPMELELLNSHSAIREFFESEITSDFDLGSAKQHMGLFNPIEYFRPQGFFDLTDGLFRAQSCILVARMDGRLVGFVQLEQELDVDFASLILHDNLPETDNELLPYSFYTYISNLIVCDEFKKAGVAETLVAGAVQAFANYVETACQTPSKHVLVLEAMIESAAHTKRGRKCLFLLEEILEAYLDVLDNSDVIDENKCVLTVPYFV